MDFVAQQHWDQSYQEIEFSPPGEDDFLRQTLLRYIPASETGKALEIGCYPGGYLSVLGDLGYELHGIDLTPKTKDLIDLFKQHHYKVGSIEQADYTTFHPSIHYDVVVSFGFIEHFEKYQEVILRQAAMVKEGGYLVISAPNFRGFFQYMFHLLCDTPGLRRHNIQSMKPKEWAVLLKNQGFDVLWAGYGGGAFFWMDNDQFYFQKIVGRIFLSAHKWMGRIFRIPYALWNHPSIACDCVVVAKKRRLP